MSGEVRQFDLSGANCAIVASGLSSAEGITCGPDGMLYVAQSGYYAPGTRRIIRLNPADGSTSIVLDFSSTPGPLASSGGPEGPIFNGGELFFNTTNYSAPSTGVWRLPLSGPPVQVMAALQRGEGIAFLKAAPYAGHLVAVDADAGVVLRIPPPFNAVQTGIAFIAGLGTPNGIAVNDSGYVFVGEHDGRISKFKPDGTPLGVFANAGAEIRKIAFDASRNLYAAGPSFGVREFGPNGGELPAIGPVAGANGVAVCGFSFATASPCPEFPPVVPDPCSAIPMGCDVVLHWSNVPNETGYEILRDGNALAVTGADTTTVADSPPVGPHVYSIRAVNGYGASAYCDASVNTTASCCQSASTWVQNGVRLHASVHRTYGASIPFPVMADGRGGAIVVWPECPTAQRVTCSGAISASWPADGVPLGSDHCPPENAIADGIGGALAAWQDGAGAYVQRVDSTGAIVSGWPATGVLLTSAAVPGIPGMASDGAGGAFVTITGNSLNDMRVQRVTAGGTAGPPPWPGAGLILCTSCPYYSGYGPFVDLAPDGTGGLLITWVAWDNIVRVQRITASGSISIGWPSGGRPLGLAAGRPRIVGDGQGNAIVAWARYSPSGIYAHRVRSDGSLDPSWPNDGKVIGTTADDDLVLVNDFSGGALAAWIQYSSDSLEDVYAQHVTSSGTIASGWPALGLAVCSAAGDQWNAAIAEDGSGGAFIAWDDQRSSVYRDIYAQHLRSDGSLAPGWEAGGRLICGARGYQVSPSISHVGPDRAIIAWLDFRDGYYSDDCGPYGCAGYFYAQVDSVSGIRISPPEQVAVGNQPEPRFTLAVGPNPSPGNLRIDLTMRSAGPLWVRVVDLAGRAVRTIERGGTVAAGRRTLAWDGRNDEGRPVASGIYLIRVKAGTEHGVRRIAIIH